MPVKTRLIIACLVFGLIAGAGCASRRNTIQFRLAGPMVAPDEEADFNPPVVSFKRQTYHHKDNAVIAWENPEKPFDNRVDLRQKAEYDVAVILPENFEFRRMHLLQAKTETLYAAIEAADVELRDNTRSAAKLLSSAARQSLIDDCKGLQVRIDEKQIGLVRAKTEAEVGRIDKLIDNDVEEMCKREEKLRKDDVARDTLLSPTMVESLVNQIEDWRTELDKAKGRIVALRLMVQNGNTPYPRIIRGSLETFRKTPFTEAGAIPFALEDEYLDWIREDKVVTVVFYDPNEVPSDPEAAAVRHNFPEYWPQDDLMVMELTHDSSSVARGAHSGTAPNTLIRREHFWSVKATTFKSKNGYLRTYLKSTSGDHLWVFGPDLTPPANIEVWLKDEEGLPSIKLYPPDARQQIEQVFVSQIAGVEGGVFDPVREAEKRGKIVAIARLGNWREKEDHFTIQGIYERELRRAKTRAQ